MAEEEWRRETKKEKEGKGKRRKEKRMGRGEKKDTVSLNIKVQSCSESLLSRRPVWP